METKMIREFNIENNELITREGSPLIEITHFNDENEYLITLYIWQRFFSQD